MTADAAAPTPPAATVGVVLKGYPRLSETFIAQELLGLERRGLALALFSLRHPTDRAVHPVHREIRAPVTYLPEYLHHEPLRVLRGLAAAARTPGFGRALRRWLDDLRRDPTRNRVRRFGQAAVLARELPRSITALYAHFLHTPASVTRYAALMTGRPWSASAHAKDIWTTPDWEKREKLAEVRWLATCTAVNRDHLSALAADPGRVHLVYHGLDLTRFPRPPDRPEGGDGSPGRPPVTILSVGRLVEKKGYDHLLDALARLPDGLDWRFVHIGGGPLAEPLAARAARLGLDDRVDWRGAQPQEAVLAAYRSADLFALASRIARDGDRDGLPNVLMEAQSQELACLATRVSAIPELILDGETGVLVPPGDPGALAAALARLIRDPGLRRRLGRAGRDRVRTRFTFEAGLDRLAERFGLGATDHHAA